MKKNVEAIHPLTPVQEGMLFHSLASPGAGAYIGQILCELEGELDLQAFRRAWERLVERHAVLRTAFLWEEVERPLQVVLRQVELPLEHEDARGATEEEIEKRVEARLENDLEDGFDLERPPLLRLWLLRTGEQTHRFLWTQHHATLDGWSLALLLEEAFTLYDALASPDGRPVEPRLPARRPYKEYLRWLEKRDPGAAEEYWRGALEGADLPTPLELAPPPAGAERAAGRGEARHRLAPRLTTALEDFARQRRLTLNHLVVGAWAAFLERTSGRGDVVFGSVVSGRPPELPGVEGMVGLFINTLPLRVVVEPAKSAAEWLEEVRERQLELQAHESTPLARIQEWSGTPAGTPLFESIVVFENYPIGAAVERGRGADGDGRGLRIRAARSRESAHYPLVLLATPGESLELGLIYDRARFAPSAARRLLRQLETWLEALPENASAPLRELPFLSAAEQAQALLEWNDAAVSLPEDPVTLHGWIARRAERTPEAVALVYEEHALTYGELLGRARHLAWRLHELEIGPESVVAVALERSCELLVGLLGVLEAGAAYLPLDSEYPPGRLAFMLEDSGAAALLVGDAVPAGLTVPDGLPVLEIEGMEESREETPAAAATSPPLSGGNAAYVIYTSGSTGRPKGAVNTHAAIVNRLCWMQARYGLGASDRVLQKTPISFDVSVWELFWPLMTGARLVLARPGGHRDGAYLRRLMAEQGITTLHFVPAMLAAFLEEPELGELTTVRRVIASGEALSGELAGRFMVRMPRQARLYNLYGPTEAAIDVSHHPCSRSDAAAGAASVPIGRPTWNTRLLVLDRHGRPAPIGAPGHLHLGGVQLARGYHRRPALTASVFVPDPFAEREGERLYRSGDLARRRGDGEIEFLGRLDHQVKLRGFRIELGEIEAALERQAGVVSAAVVERRDLPGGRGLVAWVASSEEGAEAAEALREALAGELPGHMVPAAIVVLEALPKNASGKIDRRALAARPISGRAAPGGAARHRGAAPRTPTEERVALAWEQILDLDHVHTGDSFFELGGHSLLALRVVARMRQEFGLELPVNALFEHPTLAELAAEIERRAAASDDTGASASAAAALPRIEPDVASHHEPFPLTDVQQAYWIGRRGDFELGAVATQVYLEFDAPNLDLGRLETAWRRLISRHGMLRAVIDEDGRQRVLPKVPPYEIIVHDLRQLPEESLDSTLEKRRQELSHRVLPSASWPLFDVQASLLPDGSTRLHLSVDALIADAWSYQVLSRELARLYADPAADLPPIELAFRDYVLAEEELRRGEAFQRAREYWRKRLPELPPAPQLPLARRPGELAEQRFSRRRHALPEERWRALEHRSRKARLTPSATLLAAFSAVLAAWSKSPSFTLNLTLFQRLPLHPDVERLIGDFTSLTLLAVDNAGRTFAERAQALQKRLWEDLEHRLVSGVEVLRELRRAAAEDGDSDGAAALMPVVFTSTLNLAGDDEAFELPGEVVYSITQTPQVWLDHQVGERDGEWVLIWDALEELFPAGLLDAMWSAYVELVERLADDAASWSEPLPVSALLPSAGRALVAEVNDTAAPLDERLLHLHALAGGEGRATAPALISGERTVSHGELRALAACLGHRLRDAGAAPGTLVAVVLEKSWEQAAAALGVLAAGAAYLPLDPALPKTRLQSLLEVGEVRLVVTRRRFAAGAEALAWPAGVELVVIDEPELLDATELLGATRSAAEPESELPELPEPVQRMEDLAYVIFTSGSTGQPKGVMIDHRGAVNTLADVERRFGLEPDDRVLALSALSFDLSVFDVFGVLGAGGAVVVPDELGARDPAHWAEMMRQHKVTVWNSVPALLDLYVEYLEQHPDLVPEALRLVLLSGDWIPLALPDRLRALCPHALVVSLGGATEGSIWSILHPVGAVDPAWPSIPYGRPMDNQHFYVVDDDLEPRPVFVPGELMIGGIGVAQGYWRDAERTVERFVVHPRTGERLYRTGDLGRLLPSGEIEFLGREDFQVKIRGHRVELGEIEAALASHPKVADAVLSAPAAQEGARAAQRRLVAHVVRADGMSGDGVSADELRQHLASRLPAYMVPALYDFRAAMPLTVNGKIDRGALARAARDLGAPGTAPGAAGAALATASGDASESGAAPWVERLKPLVEEIFSVDGGLDPSADLLALGASSVDLIRIGNRLEAEYAYRPPIHEIYADPSVRGLARLYEEHATDAGPPGEEPAADALVAGAAPEEVLAASFGLLRDPVEREAFKERRPGLREAPDEPGLELSRDNSAAVERLFEIRRSYRHFRREPLPADAFGRLLSALREERLEGGAKYLYGSAGGLYPVQTHVIVRPGRIDGLAGGAYYYHPVEHRLVSLDPGADLPAELCDPLVNGPILEEAAFALFLVGELAAVGPIYGATGYRFALLEAGYMSQLLMMLAPEHDLGLCPIGRLDFDLVRGAFGLGESQVLLHCLLGGAIDPERRGSEIRLDATPGWEEEREEGEI